MRFSLRADSARAAGARALVLVAAVVLVPQWGRHGGPATVAQAGQQPKQIEGDHTSARELESRGDEASAQERRAANVFRLLRDHPLSSDTGRIPQIEAALDETVDFKVEPQSLRDALALFSKKFRIPILTDDRSLGDANVDLAHEVKLTVTHLTLRDTLELLLTLDGQPLSFEIRHGTLVVATIDRIKEDLEVVVYDCRDLALIGTLDHYASGGSTGNGAFDVGGIGMGGGRVGGMFQIQQPPANPPVAPQNGPLKPAAPADHPPGRLPEVGGAAPVPVAPVPPPKEADHPAFPRPAPRLPIVQTILSAVGPDEWDEGATITELGGLIVVRQNRFNHDKIKSLLADVRRMRAIGAFAPSAKAYEDEIKRRGESEANGPAVEATDSRRPSAAQGTDKTRPADPRTASPAPVNN